VEKFIISDDKTKLDLNLVHGFLTKTYWAKNRSLEDVKLSIENSICFGVYLEEKQVGFARVLTDFVTIAYLMDVFIIDDFRGRSLSKILLKNIFEDNRFNNVKKWMLATLDAHELYKKFGFKGISSPEKLMEKI
jgi:N-acetylglutamate synthase-like GNAT family acetyltransferase